ncbi:MAG: hypothetical protein IPO36_10905 [Anaerolineales bacterium]|nr:hypothetical protein [Anaerolineales bacterium]
MSPTIRLPTSPGLLCLQGETYQLEISNATTFATKQQTFTGATGILTYTATTIPDGLWYWHVRAVNVNGVVGTWSAYRSFTVDTNGPSAPTLSAPANAATVTGTPAFSWAATTTAVKYQFEYDNDADFSSPLYTSGELTTTSHTPPVMALGAYSWHVRAKDAAGNWGPWSLTRTITIQPLVPVAPALTTPAASAVTNDSTPDFVWASVVSGDTYQLEISNATTFATKQQTFSGAPGVLTYTATNIPDGLWYWHVRAVNVNGVAGAWSAYRSFTVDTTAPVAPTLSSPANAASVIGTAAFSWTSVATASKYQFEYDNDIDFSSPVYTSGELTTTSHTPPAMALGTYSWHVRAKDAAGNWSAWSTVRTVTVLSTIPVAPALTAPANAAVTNDPTPDFTWASVTAGDTYQLEISNASTFATKQQTFSGAPGVLTYTATNIPDGLWYWHVRAVNVNGTAGPWSAYRSFTVDTVAPVAPTLSSPANAASVSGTPAFSWASVATAAKYQFEYDNDADFSSPVYTSADLTTTSHTPPSIAQGVYSWHVRAKDAAGNWGPWSTARTVTIFPLVPATPTLVSPAYGALSRDPAVTLTWNAMSNAATYQVQVDNNSTFSSPEFDTTTPDTSILTTEFPDGVYYWRVRQTDILGGVSLWSTVWRVTIIRPTPNAPATDTPAIVDTTGTPTFTWNSVQYGVNYIVQVDNDSNFSSPLVDDVADTLSRSFVTPFASGQYYWRVRAISEYGIIGPWSTTWTLTVDLVPAAPTLLLPADAATSLDGESSFSWQSAANADEYQIQVDNDSDFSSPEFDNTAPQTTRGLPAALTDGTYFWRVRGVNGVGSASEWSVVRELTVDIPPAAPTLLTPEADSTNADGLPTLSWDAVAGSFSYEIQVDDNANFSSLVHGSTVDSSMREVVLALANGTYHWRIRAVNILGTPGDWSAVWTFTVDVPPVAPILLEPEANSINIDGLPMLHWGSVTGGIAYEVQLNDSEDFGSPLYSMFVYALTLNLATPLDNGTYHWRVRAMNMYETLGPWSAAQSFAVDAEIVTPPPLPWPPTSTALPTITATITQSPTPTKTSTITSSPTRTPSVTPSKTYTPTRTPTSSRTPTKTLTPTMTRTPTQTFTPTLTPAPVCTNIYIDRARFNGDSFEARVTNDNPSTAYLVETILTWDPSPLTNGRFFDRALWNAVAYSDPANVANSESPVVTSSIPPELSLPGNGNRITWDADFSDSNFTGLYAITLTFNYPGWGDCVLSADTNMYTPTSTQTPFDTPSPTLTHTPTTTATATNTAINTPTSTPTASPTRTPTSTSTVDPTETYTPTPTATPTKTPTVTPTSTYCQDC